MNKIRSAIAKFCDIVELVFAIIIGIALIYTAINYLLSQFGIVINPEGTEWFMEFLHNMFNLVIGVEFIEMLFKPSIEHAIEVLAYFVARHLIIGTNTATGILLSVICIILLYGFLSFLHARRNKAAKAENTEAQEH